MEDPRVHHRAERLPISLEALGKDVNWREGQWCVASWKVPALCLGFAE